MKDKCSNENFNKHKDSPLAHTVSKTVDSSKRSGVRFWQREIWTSESPDLNPLDCCFSLQNEAKTYLKFHHSLAVLKKDVKKTVESLEISNAIFAVSSFRQREEAIIKAEGRHVK